MLNKDDMDGEIMRHAVVDSEYEEAVKACIDIKTEVARKECVDNAIDEYRAAINSFTEAQAKYDNYTPYNYNAVDWLFIGFFIALVLTAIVVRFRR